MKTREKNQKLQEDLPAVREQTRMPPAPPCGSPVCLHCHINCGADVAWAAYLSSFNDEPGSGG